MIESLKDDFEVEYCGGRLELRGGRALSGASREYLEAYLRKVSGYRPIGFYRGSPVLSLYQPPLASAAGIRSLKMRLRRRFERARIPAVATLAVNRACQCRCEHCSAVFYNHSQRSDLSVDQWRQAIAQSTRLGVTQFVFVGGEPLLRRDLVELFRAVPQTEANAILFTNGERMAEPLALDLVASGLMGAFVSLDDYRELEHDRLRRRPGLFAKAVAGILEWVRRGILVGISSYLSPERLEAGVFEAMMELGRELGVNELTFFDAIPSGRWLHSDAQLLRPEDRRRIRELVTTYRKKEGYPGVSAQSLLTSGEGGSFCFAANTQFYLNAHGEMCPCDFTPLSVGNCLEENIESLWSRLIRTSPYDCRAKSCRMQDPEFRRRWISPIPVGAQLPMPLREPSR